MKDLFKEKFDPRDHFVSKQMVNGFLLLRGSCFRWLEVLAHLYPICTCVKLKAFLFDPSKLYSDWNARIANFDVIWPSILYGINLI